MFIIFLAGHAKVEKPTLCASTLLIHTHPQIPTQTHSRCSKADFSHSVLTSVPQLHRLQFSDLIGPTNWPSAHLMLTRNGPITVYKAAHNLELRSGLEPAGRSISVPHSPGQCITGPSKACIHAYSHWKKQSAKPWCYMKLCVTL